MKIHKKSNNNVVVIHRRKGIEKDAMSCGLVV